MIGIIRITKVLNGNGLCVCVYIYIYMYTFLCKVVYEKCLCNQYF